MDTDDRKTEVLRGLQKHLSRLDEITKDADARPTHAQERLTRWKARVVQYLRLNVAEIEADRFANITPFKYSPVLSTQLKYEIPRYINALNIVIEEVEDNPYLLTQPLLSPGTSEPEAKPYKASAPAPSEANDNQVAGIAQDTRNVFVVHGRNNEARKALFGFLRSIGLKPLEWSQAIKATGKASPFIGEILDVAFSKAQAVLVLMTPDDVARLQEQLTSPHDPPYESQLTGQARPNVLFEAGMAMGRNPDRTVIVELGTLRPFSDIAGRHTVRLTNDSAARQELAQRLETAGCVVDLTGRDWHTEGDFNLSA